MRNTSIIFTLALILGFYSTQGVFAQQLQKQTPPTSAIGAPPTPPTEKIQPSTAAPISGQLEGGEVVNNTEGQKQEEFKEITEEEFQQLPPEKQQEYLWQKDQYLKNKEPKTEQQGQQPSQQKTMPGSTQQPVKPEEKQVETEKKEKQVIDEKEDVTNKPKIGEGLMENQFDSRSKKIGGQRETYEKRTQSPKETNFKSSFEERNKRIKEIKSGNKE